MTLGVEGVVDGCKNKKATLIALANILLVLVAYFAFVGPPKGAL
ncbi:MAG: hypothetical protein ACR2PG_08095 [Hyphomicrobiaceae bacterium]